MFRKDLTDHRITARRRVGEGHDGLSAQQELCLILYPKELEDDIVELLEAEQVPGYTAMPKMLGRGRRIRHFDNAVWPGATGAVFSVVSREQASALSRIVRDYAERLDARSHGLYGVHFFTLPCRQLI